MLRAWDMKDWYFLVLLGIRGHLEGALKQWGLFSTSFPLFDYAPLAITTQHYSALDSPHHQIHGCHQHRKMTTVTVYITHEFLHAKICLLVFIYKRLHGLCDVSLSITFANNSTRGNSFKLVKPSCHCDVWKYFLVVELLMSGTVFLKLLWNHRPLIVLKTICVMLILVNF